MKPDLAKLMGFFLPFIYADWRTYRMKKNYKKTLLLPRAGHWILTSKTWSISPSSIFIIKLCISRGSAKEQPYEYTRERNPTRDHLIRGVYVRLEGGLGGEVIKLRHGRYFTLVANILRA